MSTSDGTLLVCSQSHCGENKGDRSIIYMKQVAIGRKNWLFIGSVAAGERAADFLTLVSSALRNDLDVYTYVKAVLDALLTGSTDYESLRADKWAAAHPEAIRVYRQDERRDRFAAKAARREDRRQTKAPAETSSTPRDDPSAVNGGL